MESSSKRTCPFCGNPRIRPQRVVNNGCWWGFCYNRKCPASIQSGFLLRRSRRAGKMFWLQCDVGTETVPREVVLKLCLVLRRNQGRGRLLPAVAERLERRGIRPVAD